MDFIIFAQCPFLYHITSNFRLAMMISLLWAEEVLDLDISNIQRLDNLVINSLKITRERFTLAPEVSNLLHSGLLLGHVSEKSSNRQMQNWSQQHRNWRRRKLSCR